MATLAETPSHGRLPKNLNTKLVKLFPPRPVGVYYREASKVPGVKCTCLSHNSGIFYNLFPHSTFSLLCLVAVFCCLQYLTGSLMACFRNCLGGFHELIHWCYAVRFPCYDAPCLPVFTPFHLDCHRSSVRQSVLCHAGGILV